MKPQTLFGRPIVEVDDTPVDEIRFGHPIGIWPLRVRPAVAATPTDPVRFIIEVKARPGLHTMEAMRDE